MTDEPAPPLEPVGPLVGRGRAPDAGGRDDDAAPGDLRPPGGPDAHGARAIPRPGLIAATRTWPLARVRLGLGVALVVGLAAAWILLAPGGTPAAITEPRATTAPAAATAPTTVTPTTAAVAEVPAWVPRAIASTCRARAGAAPATVVVDCNPGRGVARLRYTAFGSLAALRDAYAVPAPRAALRRNAESTTPVCARGARDERAWSTATHPSATAGRFRCTRANGSARIVWTDEATRVLAAASRNDADLQSLYAWWTTVPGPSPAGGAR